METIDFRKPVLRGSDSGSCDPDTGTGHTNSGPGDSYSCTCDTDRCADSRAYGGTDLGAYSGSHPGSGRADESTGGDHSGSDRFFL